MKNDLNDFEEKLKSARAAGQPASPSTEKQQETQNNNVGMRAGMEMVVSIIAGAGIGIGIDKWLGSAPWGLIGFFFLGCGAAFMSVYRLTKNADSAVGFAALQKQDEAIIKPPETDH